MGLDIAQPIVAALSEAVLCESSPCRAGNGLPLHVGAWALWTRLKWKKRHAQPRQPRPLVCTGIDVHQRDTGKMTNGHGGFFLWFDQRDRLSIGRRKYASSAPIIRYRPSREPWYDVVTCRSSM